MSRDTAAFIPPARRSEDDPQRNHPDAVDIITGALLDIMAEPNLTPEEAATDYILKQLNDAGFGVVRLED